MPIEKQLLAREGRRRRTVHVIGSHLRRVVSPCCSAFVTDWVQELQGLFVSRSCFCRRLELLKTSHTPVASVHWPTEYVKTSTVGVVRPDLTVSTASIPPLLGGEKVDGGNLFKHWFRGAAIVTSLDLLVERLCLITKRISARWCWLKSLVWILSWLFGIQVSAVYDVIDRPGNRRC